ncbi:MAG: hypothetical protein ACFCGT_24050, partial [Sandaracinaceae bacterium]
GTARAGRPRAGRPRAGRPRAGTAGALLAALAAIAVSAVAPPAVGQEPAAPATLERARALFVEGTEHYAEGSLNEALEAFLSAWRLVPSPALAYNVGRLYERMGEARQGILFYRRYLERAAPDAAERAEVEARIAELEAMEQRQREGVIALPPSRDELTQEARRFFLVGVSMYRRQDYQAAQQAFMAAYTFARLPEVTYNLAVTAERLGQTRDAVDFYREYARTLPRESAERALVEARVRQLRAAR